MSFPLPVQADYSLLAHNTFGIDVRALAYLRVFAADTLRAVMRDPILAALPRLVLGGGSNLVFVRDFPGLVLHMCNRGMTVIAEDADATYVRAAAGENWHQFVQWTLAAGLPGLENLSLIPGTVGAAPIQNIGAYGVEINSLLHAVDVLDLASGEVSTMDGAACEFAYRDSVFKHRLRDRVVITEVTFRLPKKWQPNIAYADVAQELAAKNITQPTALQISEAVIAIRTRKLPDPTHIGNAGSFFKNPVVTAEQRNALLARFPQLVSHLQPGGSFKLAAGWMIDQCGWKGKRLGPAGVYEKQALVLVNHGGAAGEEVAALAQRIQQDVRERFGVSLEPEPTFV